ncbi:MAG: hypothetical protein NC133_00485 [Prevotella sp.]|nr:hypothetical protein [Prevotella sp.]
MEKSEKNFKTTLGLHLAKHKTLFTFAICLLMIIFCTLAVWVKNGDIYFDDVKFHASRVQSIADGLRGGQFPVKYYADWYNGAGYISSLFYGDIFLYLPALFVLMGVPLKVTYLGFILTIYILIAVTMFFLARKFFDKNWSMICATIFTLSPYIFGDIFHRGAIGEIVGIIFLLLLFLGIYNLLKENYSRPWLLSISFIGLLYSHMTSLVIAAVVLIIFVLCHAKTLCKQRQFWLKSLLALVVFVAVGAYQIFSFLEMYFADTYCVAEGWAVLTDAAYSLFDLFFGSVYGMGAIMLIPFLLRFLVQKDAENLATVKFLDKLLIISGVLILVISAAFPWHYLQKTPIAMLQFPWRLNTIPTVMLSIALVIELQYLFHSKNKIKQRLLVVTLCFIAIFCLVYNNLLVFLQQSYTIENPTQEGIMRGETGNLFEYVPLKLKYAENKWWLSTDLLDEQNQTVAYERKAYTTDITFVADDENTYYDLPIIYYQGYSATITLGDGTVRQLKVVQSDTGKSRVITDGLAGTIQFKYTGTAIQTIGLIISTVSVGGLVCWVVFLTMKKKIQSQQTAKIHP